MSEFLSDEWVMALDDRLRAQPEGSSPEPLTVQYVVSRADDSIARYHLQLGPEGDRARVGDADAPDVTFRMSIDTARDISDGSLSSEEAFLTGRLDLDGDTGALIEAYRSADPGTTRGRDDNDGSSGS